MTGDNMNNLTGIETINIILGLFQCSPIEICTDTHEIPATTGIYVIWRHDDLLYVGKSIDMRSRVHKNRSQHQGMQDGWSHIGYVQVWNGRKDALEVALIGALNPRLNRAWASPGSTPCTTNPEWQKMYDAGAIFARNSYGSTVVALDGAS